MVHSRVVVHVAGNRRYVDAGAYLADLSKKLRGLDLPSGQTDILVYEDGSVGVDGYLVWQPKRLQKKGA